MASRTVKIYNLDALPSRVMDEFDVFMDSQLRKIAVKQIMSFAQKGDKFRQIILITPQVSLVSTEKRQTIIASDHRLNEELPYGA